MVCTAWKVEEPMQSTLVNRPPWTLYAWLLTIQGHILHMNSENINYHTINIEVLYYNLVNMDFTFPFSVFQWG